MLDDEMRSQIKETAQKLLAEGSLPSKEKLNSYFEHFKEKFGPEKLSMVDGTGLLELMHGRDTKESLVYWLEFKDDEEFPAYFGSIAGGSALKFGIFKKKETGAWMTGHSRNMQELSTAEAVAYTLEQRNQLIKACKLVEALPLGASLAEYKQLDADLLKSAPLVADFAWGHKYLSLMFPDKIDDYHSPDYQRYMLSRMLQKSDPAAGRYSLSWYFIQIGREVDLPINHLTTTLNELFGAPRNYWRVGTTDGGTGESFWSHMCDRGIVSVGWQDIGDLSWVSYDKASKDKLRDLIEGSYPNTSSAVTRSTNQLFKFVNQVKEGDIVLAANGQTILGIGQVTGGYNYDRQMGFPHYRPVQWLSLDEWTLPQEKEGLRTTVHLMGKYPENLIAIESRLRDVPNVVPVTRPDTTRLIGVPGKIERILDRKGQAILYGPPGTGKTYWAENAILELAARKWFGKNHGQLDESEIDFLQNGKDGICPVRFCTFHPAFGYEDFIEGYRPELIGNQMVFEERSGIFKSVCRDASQHPDRPFYLLIDEINRGDIPRIFGELLTLLEKDKRGKQVILPLSGSRFSVPPNVFVVGTMNTADRSIALLDAALRRRFGLVELMPDPEVLGDTMVEGVPIGSWLSSLNRKICRLVGRDARNLQIGHSYLLDNGRPLSSFSMFSRVLQEDILPLLEEYCYEDYAVLAQILGSGLIDVENQRVKLELFEPGKQADLVRVLIDLDPDMQSSKQALESDVSELIDEDIATEENGDDG